MRAWLFSGKPLGLFFLLLFVLSAVGDRWGIKVNLTGTNVGLCLISLILIFQDRLGPFLKRIVKVKWGDGEIELRDEVESLTEKVAKVAESAPEAPASFALMGAGPLAVPREYIVPSEPTGPLFEIAKTNPALALIEVARKIESTLRSILLGAGWTTLRPQSFKALVDTAVEKKVFSDDIASALNNFWMVRNRVVHDTENSETLLNGVFLAGMQLLGLLERLQDKYEQHEVILTNIELFQDPRLTQKIDNAKGLLIRSSRKGESLLRIFPTKKDYREGDRISWHFDMTPPYQKAAWFRNSSINGGQVTQAWSSAAHFDGEIIGTRA